MAGRIHDGINYAIGFMGLMTLVLAACSNSGSGPAAGPAVDVGSASGSGGDRVSVGTALTGGGGRVVAASAEIIYDAAQVNVDVKSDGTPSCTVNPRIGAGSAADKTLLLSVTDAGAMQKKLTVGVINLQNASVISDGDLFTCDFVIAPGAQPGPAVLQNTPGVSDAQGNDLAVTGASGTITVK
jgi:hypothetical protein